VEVPFAFRTDSRVFVNKEPVGLAVLRERIRQLLQNRTDKSVILRMDGELTIQEQIRVTEQLQAGGAEQMGLATDPITGRR
jgi:biopolymer transport protein ExbD